MSNHHMAPGTLPGITPSARPEGMVVCTYGGGVNSVAVLVLLKRLGIRPHAIVMSDPGSEWPRTYEYRDTIMPPWLEANGFPPITVVKRSEMESVSVERRESLREQCLRTSTLPSAAYGWKKCSQKFKATVVNAWFREQGWVKDEWKAKRRLVKAIGYDAGEDSRIRPEFNCPTERKRYVPWYPLYDRWYDRRGCKDLILSEGLPLPGKSACTFCPHNKDEEWALLSIQEPREFEAALELEAKAMPSITEPGTVGLRRNGRHGDRVLGEWAKTEEFAAIRRRVEAGLDDDDDDESLLPCECAL
ncbi:MAG: phosphoadenosine phosphosulfate reductase [Idiomarina sp.]|nr:phosphoadenosine phosphosulfate reductase [Idiomarina sp.]